MNNLDKIVGNHPLIAAVRRVLPRLNPKGGGIVAAVSGGPDSVAMLAALHQLGVTPLIVAHINHKLRGPESDADADFVEALAHRLGLPFRANNAPIPTGASIEATARQLRYTSLRTIANDCNISTIATAHTRDDQAETIIMRLIRGTGLAGLSGIPRVRSWNGVRIVRPLLGVLRNTVMSFLDTSGLEHRTDSSNANPAFTRNRIRREIMPALRQVAHSGLAMRLSRLAGEARKLHRANVKQACEDIAACELQRVGLMTVFSAKKLSSLCDKRLRELWRAVWQRENWPDGAMTRQHWQRLADVSLGKITAVDCPDGIRVRRLERVVRAGPGA